MAENPNNKKSEQAKFPFFSMSNQNQAVLSFLGSSEKLLPAPPPCVEVLFSEASLSPKATVESINLDGGLTLYKGRVNTSDVFGVSNSDLVPGKYEGGLKLWEGSLDLVKTLFSEVQDGRLSLIGKRVLELGCGHGLPGIFTCLEGATAVHFQDFNAEVLRYLTIPNVKANLSREPILEHSFLKNEAKMNMSADIRFFAGDWSEIHHLLFPRCNYECPKAPDSSSKHDPFEGYDIILMAETVYSLSSIQSLYGLIKKCLCLHHGVVYLAAKKHYFGVGGGTRQFLSVVEEDGFMAGDLIAEIADGSSNVREVWKLSFK